MSVILQKIDLAIEDEKDDNSETHLLDNAIVSVKTQNETEDVSDSYHTENGTPWIQTKNFKQTKLF